MNEPHLLVTCASWEDRFLLGLQRTLEEARPRRVLMLFFRDFADWTASNREEIVEICRDRGVDLADLELGQLSCAENWHKLASYFSANSIAESNVLVDLTTMPRETIFNTFLLLEIGKNRVRYIYWQPEGYSEDWLSRDPGKPRMVYKLSGLAKLGARTALVVLAGYDEERIRQLIDHFEPSVTLLGLQANGGDSDNERWMCCHRKSFAEDKSKIFEINAYSDDHGESSIAEAVAPYLHTHNVVLSSLGPKPSAIALYRSHMANPQLGIAYGPARQFNREYSHGLGDSIQGSLIRS